MKALLTANEIPAAAASAAAQRCVPWGAVKELRVGVPQWGSIIKVSKGDTRL